MTPTRKFLLAGASGFLGTALRVRLAQEGHHVTRLVRREPTSGSEFRWDPDRGEMDQRALDGVDVVVNLAGAGVADRPWTPARRRLLVSSRLNPTQTLAAALATRANPPVLIQGSAIGWYGVEPSVEPHVEGDPAADDFLAQLVSDWEAAAQPAADAGSRVVKLRTSLVMDRSGGILAMMRIPFSLGLGARFGDGSQHLPIISLQDWLAAVLWLIETESANGPYNLTIPQPVTNREFTAALAAALHRPAFLVAPAPVLRVVLGEVSNQLLGDQHAIPERLTAAGFAFTSPDAESVFRTSLT